MDTREALIDVKVVPVPVKVDEDKNKVEEDPIPLPPNPTSPQNLPSGNKSERSVFMMKNLQYYIKCFNFSNIFICICLLVCYFNYLNNSELNCMFSLHWNSLRYLCNFRKLMQEEFAHSSSFLIFFCLLSGWIPENFLKILLVLYCIGYKIFYKSHFFIEYENNSMFEVLDVEK